MGYHHTALLLGTIRQAEATEGVSRDLSAECVGELVRAQDEQVRAPFLPSIHPSIHPQLLVAGTKWRRVHDGSTVG